MVVFIFVLYYTSLNIPEPLLKEKSEKSFYKTERKRILPFYLTQFVWLMYKAVAQSHIRYSTTVINLQDKFLYITKLNIFMLTKSQTVDQ